ncbi:hypothetical protein NCAS_0G01890 [Naumovozyma castellii]|uniref:Uncharacterized protein n=1 Tax=Naumovozyma castellii TaxID=27288 RepID=G0VI42_NAUCA|nr:hypothetical protein NCAS_0G01890 [Naumovozyma castellii CBS 4309]CCC71076.1 hypothetical protein NCAS_0G01890 [Naumovozyma castellii CBS 4309]
MNNEIYEMSNQNESSNFSLLTHSPSPSSSILVKRISQQGITEESKETVITNFNNGSYLGVRSIIISNEDFTPNLPENKEWKYYELVISQEYPRCGVCQCLINQYRETIFLYVRTPSLINSLSTYLLKECFKDKEKKKKPIKTVISKLHEYTEDKINHDIRVACKPKKLTLEFTDDDIAYSRQVIKKEKEMVEVLRFKSDYNKAVLQKINGRFFFWRRVPEIKKEEELSLRYIKKFEIDLYKEINGFSRILLIQYWIRIINWVLLIVQFILAGLLLRHVSLGGFGWGAWSVLSLGVLFIRPIIERIFFKKLDPQMVSIYRETYWLKPWKEKKKNGNSQNNAEHNNQNNIESGNEHI